MSASQEKLARKQQREEGSDKRQLAAKKAEKAKKRKEKNWTIGIAVVVVIFAGALLWNSSFFNGHFAAVKIGDQSYTAAEFSFFYNTTYNNFVSQYGDYISYIGLDTTKDPADQEYEDGKTWADYFKESAIATMQEITALYEEAQKDGFVLSEEDQASLDSSLENMKTSYTGSGYNSADEYLSAAYGKGCTVEVISGILEKYYISQAYAQQKYDSLTYTSADLKAYYEENKNDLDQYTYIAYFADGSVKEDTTDTTDTTEPSASPDAAAEDAAKAEAMAAAKKIADAIVDGSSSAETFKVAVFTQSGTEISESTTQGGSLSSNYADWLKDASRKEGDKTVIESDTGYYALYFVSRNDNSYKTINVRHILIKAVASEDGTYTDEAKAEAKSKAETLLAAWQAGDATEDSFAKLANENSEDSGSNTNGGLYEGVYKGQMVTEFNDWCFAEDRKTGDTGIVFNQDSNYCGYHVVYFVGESDTTYADTLAEDGIRNKDYSAWKDALLANYETSTGWTAFLVKKAGI